MPLVFKYEPAYAVRMRGNVHGFLACYVVYSALTPKGAPFTPHTNEGALRVPEDAALFYFYALY